MVWENQLGDLSPHSLVGVAFPNNRDGYDSTPPALGSAHWMTTTDGRPPRRATAGPPQPAGVSYPFLSRRRLERVTRDHNRAGLNNAPPSPPARALRLAAPRAASTPSAPSRAGAPARRSSSRRPPLASIASLVFCRRPRTVYSLSDRGCRGVAAPPAPWLGLASLPVSILFFFFFFSLATLPSSRQLLCESTPLLGCSSPPPPPIFSLLAAVGAAPCGWPWRLRGARQ